MRRAIWFFSSLIAMVGFVAADKPDQSVKTPTPKAEGKGKASAAAPAKSATTAGQSKTKAVLDPRATSLFRSAQNLEKAGKKPGAIGLYRDVMIRYAESPEARESEARLKALGGKIPAPSEIDPAPPAQEAKFTRAPKPKYVSQEANRAALNQAIGGAVDGAASPPAGGMGGGGGYGNQGGGYR